jgi:hypothetical protein
MVVNSRSWLDQYIDSHAPVTTSCPNPTALGSPCHHTTLSIEPQARYFRAAFVRDPLDRFLSGVHESGSWQESRRDEVRKVRGVARDLELHPCTKPSCHLATQSYFLSSTDSLGMPIEWDFLGRVERLSDDWDALRAVATGFTSFLIEGEANATRVSAKSPPTPHRNAKDTAATDRIGQAAFADGATLCHVCNVFMQDFVCLGYAFPAACCRPAYCAARGVALAPDRLRVACSGPIRNSSTTTARMKNKKARRSSHES